MGFGESRVASNKRRSYRPSIAAGVKRENCGFKVGPQSSIAHGGGDWRGGGGVDPLTLHTHQPNLTSLLRWTDAPDVFHLHTANFSPLL